jgi:hypothetical protein
MAGMEKRQDIQSVVEVTRKRTFKKKGKEHIEEEITYSSITLALWEMMSKRLPGQSAITGRTKIVNIGYWTLRLEKMKARYMLRTE